MPFTLTHIAVCLPLIGRGTAMSALVVGCISPDIAYFLPIQGLGRFSHSCAGLVLFCVPVGLMILWIFHRFLKGPLIALLPADHQQRLLPFAKSFPFLPCNRLFLIVLSLVFGAFTHLLWDSFTHSRGWFVQNFALLKMTVLDTRFGPVTMHRILQSLSNAVGLGFMWLWYVRRFREKSCSMATDAVQPGGKKKVLLVSVTTLIGLLLAFGYGFSGVSAEDLYPLRKLLNRTVMAFLSFLMAELLLYAGFWNMSRAGEGLKDN